MIIDFFLAIISAIALTIVSWLPDAGSITTQVTAALSYVIGAAYAWNEFLPVDTTLTIMTLVLGFQAAEWSFKLFMRIAGRRAK